MLMVPLFLLGAPNKVIVDIASHVKEGDALLFEYYAFLLYELFISLLFHLTHNERR